ncbi:MAG: 50S ribosomal protein L10 [Fervidicoccaceae archaeon]
MRLVQKKREIPRNKKEEVEELERLFKEYPVLAVIDASSLSATLLQKVKYFLKKKYGDSIVIKSTKNNLLVLAAKLAGIKGAEDLESKIKGQKIFIFSKLNPFILYSQVTKIKLPAPAKAGMKVEKEIAVEPMDTKLPPGPLLSAFGKLRIPTKVQGGTIWIAKRTVLAKPGDVITEDLASMLQRLGIYPAEEGISIEFALDNGVILGAQQLKIDVEQYAVQLAQAFSMAIGFASEIAYPEPDVLKLSIAKAFRKALAVATETAFVTPETAEAIISAALKRANAIVLAMGDKAKELGIEAVAPVAVAAAPATQPAAEQKPKEEKKEEKAEEEEKKELSEEELSSGLGALFGP